MARRMIDTSMWSNENFAALPAMARLLLVGIITLADDQGRCKANPAYLRSQIFPYDDVSTPEIDCWLQQMAANGTVILYTVDNKSYLQLTNWWDYQPLDWARPSDYQPPTEWRDRIRYNAKGGAHLTYNWKSKAGVSSPDTCDSKGSASMVAAPIAPETSCNTPIQVDTQVPAYIPAQVDTPTNKLNLNKTNLSAETHARATPPKTPPPQSTRRDITHRQAQRNSGYTLGDYPGCKPQVLTHLTNCVKRIYRYDALIDDPGDDRLEDKMRREAYRLWERGYTTEAEMDILALAWDKRAEGFHDKRPFGDQLYELSVSLRSRQPEIDTSTLDFAYEDTQ